MSKDKERIILGSGKLYVAEFVGTVPDTDTICIEDNLFGYVSGGATLEYKPTYYSCKDDLGFVEKTILTEEEATLKSGIMTFNAGRLQTLCSTGRTSLSEDKKHRIVKIGGVSNDNGKRYVICFHHVDKKDGDIWVVIVGQNQSGFSIAFAKDKETVVDAEFKALVQDKEGTIITYIEEILDASVATPEVSQQSEPASTTAKSATAKVNS